MTEPTVTGSPYRSPAPRSLPTDALSVPYAGQTRMRLTIASGMSRARVRVDENAQALVAIDADGGPAPRLRVTDGEVRIAWPWSAGDWLRALLEGEHHEIDVVLHPAVAWSLVSRGGVAQLEADLSAGIVSGIEIVGGCHDVELSLPQPPREVPIRIHGGASQVRLRRPADVRVAVAVSGGVSALRIDDRTFEAIGGHARLVGEGREPGYDVEVRGGAADVSVEAR